MRLETGKNPHWPAGPLTLSDKRQGARLRVLCKPMLDLIGGVIYDG